jgi:hypothetical protein
MLVFITPAYMGPISMAWFSSRPLLEGMYVSSEGANRLRRIWGSKDKLRSSDSELRGKPSLNVTTVDQKRTVVDLALQAT